MQKWYNHLELKRYFLWRATTIAFLCSPRMRRRTRRSRHRTAPPTVSPLAPKCCNKPGRCATWRMRRRRTRAPAPFLAGATTVSTCPTRKSSAHFVNVKSVAVTVTLKSHAHVIKKVARPTPDACRAAPQEPLGRDWATGLGQQLAQQDAAAQQEEAEVRS